jgi:ribosomal protein S18 acetylase RimI-like enzyme
MSRIRVLSVEDVLSFVEIRRLALSTDPDSFSAKPEADAWSKVETARQRLSTATPENGPVIVGVFDPNLVGVNGLIRSSATSSRVWGFYVRPEHRRGGIGQALIREAIEIARRMPGVVRVELGVAEASIAARHAYAKSGFHETTLHANTGTRDMVLELKSEAG